MARPSRHLRAAALVLAAAAAGGACARPGGDGPEFRPDLAGEWVLDPAAGNDSSALALAFADSADPRLRSDRSRRPLLGPGLARDTLYQQLAPVRAARLALAAVREPPERLVIAPADTVVTFGFDGGREIALGTRWQQVEGSWGDDRGWRLRARWRDGRLEVEREQTSEPGVRLREYYSRSPGGDRLVVWTVIALPGDELSVRRIYRLAAAASGASYS